MGTAGGECGTALSLTSYSRPPAGTGECRLRLPRDRNGPVRNDLFDMHLCPKGMTILTKEFRKRDYCLGGIVVQSNESSIVGCSAKPGMSWNSHQSQVRHTLFEKL